MAERGRPRGPRRPGRVVSRSAWAGQAAVARGQARLGKARWARPGGRRQVGPARWARPGGPGQVGPARWATPGGPGQVGRPGRLGARSARGGRQAQPDHGRWCRAIDCSNRCSIEQVFNRRHEYRTCVLITGMPDPRRTAPWRPETRPRAAWDALATRLVVAAGSDRPPDRLVTASGRPSTSGPPGAARPPGTGRTARSTRPPGARMQGQHQAGDMPRPFRTLEVR